MALSAARGCGLKCDGREYAYTQADNDSDDPVHDVARWSLFAPG